MSNSGEYQWDIKAFVAQACGENVSADQLKYWWEEGAILPPKTVAHPNGRGRTSLYAAGTSPQVVALVALLKQGDLAFATWRLWLAGHQVADHRGRGRIIECAAAWDRMVADVRKNAFVSKGKAFSDQVLDWVEEKPRSYDPNLRLIRKSSGGRFGSLLFRMVPIVWGVPIPTPEGTAQNPRKPDPDFTFDRQAVISGLGLGRFMADRMPGVEPMSARQIFSAVNRLAPALGKAPLKSQVKGLSDDQLRLAAWEIEDARQANSAVYGLLNTLFGLHAFGLGVFVRLFKRHSEDDRVRMVALWAVVRNEFISDPHQQPTKVDELDLRQAEIAKAEYDNLLRNNPALAEIWTAEVWRSSAIKSGTRKQHADELRRAVAEKLVRTIRNKPEAALERPGSQF